MAAVVEIYPGDQVRLRKPHPCGGYDWQVTRIGADIGLRCLRCDRRVLLARPEFERRLKTILARAAATVPGAPVDQAAKPK